MKQMKRVLAIGPVVLLALACVVPPAEAHHRGMSSFRNSHSYGYYRGNNFAVHHPYYAHSDQHRHHHGRNYSDDHDDGNSYGFGGDCGWLHCNTAMPWG